MADWIASNVEFFPLDPLHTADDPPRRPDPERTARRAAAGWRGLDLPPRWSPQPMGNDLDAVFAARFGIRTPRPMQVAAVETVRDQEWSGMVIIEAPMGKARPRLHCWPRKCLQSVPAPTGA